MNLGIPKEHPGSYHRYMFENFFQYIDIDPENAHILDGNAPDLEAECQLFEENIKRAGGINLFVGGKIQSSRYFIYKMPFTVGIFSVIL